MKKIKGFYKGRYKIMNTLERTKIVNVNAISEWNQLCNECFDAVKKNNWTKEKSRKLLQNVRKELKELETN